MAILNALMNIRRILKDIFDLKWILFLIIDTLKYIPNNI